MYNNDTLLGVWDVSSTPPGGPGAWPYYANEGYIGMWLVAASTACRLDDFSGGNSDHPHNPTMWNMNLFVEELAAVRQALGLD